MKKFIFKLGMFLCVFSVIICSMDYALITVEKKKGLMGKKWNDYFSKPTDKIIIGSSHAYAAYNMDSFFNLGTTSQSIQSGLFILDKVAVNKKMVIIDFYYNCFDTDNIDDLYSSSARFFPIPVQVEMFFKNPANLLAAHSDFIKRIITLRNPKYKNLIYGQNGHISHTGIKAGDYGPSQRDFISIEKRKLIGKNFESMISYCLRNNILPVIVVTPLNATKNYLPVNHDAVVNDISLICSRQAIKFIDLTALSNDSTLFYDEHVNVKGSELISKRVKDEINSMQVKKENGGSNEQP